MRHYPFAAKRAPKKRDNPRRVGPDRVKLDREGIAELRRQVFERSGGKCEETVAKELSGFLSTSKVIHCEGRCNAPITWDTMQLSHRGHGPRRTDTLEGTYASCAECHQVGIHNPKSVSRRPGRVMSKREALENWQGKRCYCGGDKPKESTFCANCLEKLSPQLRSDVQEVTGKEYLQTVALCEQELLAAEVNGRVA